MVAAVLVDVLVVVETALVVVVGAGALSVAVVAAVLGVMAGRFEGAVVV